MTPNTKTAPVPRLAMMGMRGRVASDEDVRKRGQCKDCRTGIHPDAERCAACVQVLARQRTPHCPDSRIRVESGTVSDPVIDRVRQLRAMGATKVRVTADGAVEADFGPEDASPPDADQNEAPKPTRRLSATGGLVPRAGDS